MAASIPYLAVSPDGSLALRIDPNGDAYGYVNGDMTSISDKAARALASRWLSKNSQNRLIAQGWLPAKASERKRLAKLPITVGDAGILVGDKPAGGKVVVYGQEVFKLFGALNRYWTPWGQMSLVAGVARKMGEAVVAYRDQFRGDLREFADYVSDLIKGAVSGGAFGTVMGVVIGGAILWLVFGGGAATATAAAVAAGRKYLK